MKKSLEYYRNLKIDDSIIEKVAIDLMEGRKKLEIHGHCISDREKVKRLVVRIRTTNPQPKIKTEKVRLKNAYFTLRNIFKNRNK